MTLTAAWLAPSPSPSPSTPRSPSPSCPGDGGTCEYIYRVTHNVWLAESGYWAIVKPVRILLIIAFALLVRFLIHRAVNRVIRHTIDGVGTGLLRPFKERAPGPLRASAPTALPSERRRQRAEALGSVLRSIASALVFAITAMLVLAELGVDLRPILASAGIVGVAIGFGAQNLVKDFVAGMCILLEDQFGVGDLVDVGPVSGTVEAVGLRITTIRDGSGAVWYIRNGEIIRVSNTSQGWGLAVVDVPVGFAALQPTMEALRRAADELAADPDWADELVGPPEVLGIEQITTEGTVLRTTAKTRPEAQARVGRELRQRLTTALAAEGLTDQTGQTTLHLGHETAEASEEQQPPAAPRKATD